jgi:RecA/RadA recombinase
MSKINPRAKAAAIRVLRKRHNRRKGTPTPAPVNKALEKKLAPLRRKYGATQLQPIAGGTRLQVQGIHSGWQALDDFLTGETDAECRTVTGTGVGWPRGRIIEAFGPEFCLDGSTFVQYNVRRSDGSVANHKGGTIERLYERFHGLSPSGDGRGKYQRTRTEDCDFFAPSVNEEDRVFQNRVVDVVCTGKRACWEVETESGARLVATKDHKFLVGSRFVALRRLRLGDELSLHRNEPYRLDEDKKPNAHRPEWLVKYHPRASIKIVRALERGYENTYRRLPRAHAVVEAAANGLSCAEYRRRLNAGELDGLYFVDPTMHVHHKNENGVDDRLENLVVVEASEHLRQHAIERHNNLRFVVVPDPIVSIKPVGERSTYDLRMEAPYNNYIANDLVVHNSGKTTLALHAIAAVQKAGGVAAFIDAEHSLDLKYAARIVDLHTLLFSQPDSAEQVIDMSVDLVRTKAVDLVVVDSVSALEPEEEEKTSVRKSHVALSARLMSRGLRKLNPVVARSGVIFLFINQVREKIGIMFGNKETTSGGRALKFYASIRLDVRKVKTLRKGSTVIGHRARIRAVKNKVAPPFRDIHVDVHPNVGIAAVYGDPDFGDADDED